MPELQDYEEAQASPVDLGPEVPDFGSAPPPPPVAAPAPLGPVGPQLIRPPVVQTISAPAETLQSPSFQARRDKQEQDFLKATYEHAQNIAQAVKDVAAARTMLGIMRVQQDKAAGMDMREANLRNMDYFTNPGDAHFAPSFNALRAPPSAPSVQNFSMPGSKDKIPVFITKDEKGQSHVQFIPKGSMPGEDKEILPKIIELEGEKYVVNPSTGHFERKDKGKTVDLTPIQMATVLKERKNIVLAQLKELDKVSSPSQDEQDERKALNQELGYLKTKFDKIGQAKGIPATPPPTGRTSMGVPPKAVQSLTRESAAAFLKQAGGDKEKARQLARQAGFSF